MLRNLKTVILYSFIKEIIVGQVSYYKNKIIDFIYIYMCVCVCAQVHSFLRNSQQTCVVLVFTLCLFFF